MTLQITVLRPGTRVKLSDCLGCSLAAVIQQVCLASSDHVTYQVTWWSGCERKTEWVEAHEVESNGNAEYTHLGFRKLEG